MAQLSEYGERVIDRVNMIGMWFAVIVCIRNFLICLDQYRRTRGKIHLVNIAQVVVFFIYRFLYGLIPLFEISTCAYYPLLVSLWHLDYLLFYTVMFLRLLILESDKNSLWIKVVGIALITLRFADWPYELAFLPVEQALLESSSTTGSTCWAVWANGVIILNFIADALANLFLSGMFVRRLYVHIRRSRKVMSHHNCVIEYIARKSLVCLALTFVVNLIMNLFKVTTFLGDRSDAFTVYFAIIESTLLVEALRVDHPGIRDQSSCQHCVHSGYTDLDMERQQKNKKSKHQKRGDEEDGNSDNDNDVNEAYYKDNGVGDDGMKNNSAVPPHTSTNKLQLPDSYHVAVEMAPIGDTTSLSKSFSLVNKNISQLYPPVSTHYSHQHQHQHQHQHLSVPYLKSFNRVAQTSSAPPFAAPVQPVVRSCGVIEAVPTMSLGSIEFDDTPKWKPTSRSGKQD